MHARSLGDTLIGRHVVEADPILLAKYKPLLRLCMHSNFIVLLYRQVCNPLMLSRNTVEKFCRKAIGSQEVR